MSAVGESPPFQCKMPMARWATSCRFDYIAVYFVHINQQLNLDAMTIKRILYAIILVGVFSFVAERHWPRSVTEASLSLQLAGEHCRYAHDLSRCYQRGFEPLRSLLTEDHDCDMWAVQCLADYRSAAAQDAMISVLETKTDVQTCDGVRPIRSQAVKYLGDFGNSSALPAVREHLASKPKSKLSSGASGCRAGPEDVEAIQSAIAKLDRR